jgi:hypothetical protein
MQEKFRMSALVPHSIFVSSFIALAAEKKEQGRESPPHANLCIDQLQSTNMMAGRIFFVCNPNACLLEPILENALLPIRITQSHASCQ